MRPIVVDANVFLRFFVRSETPEDVANAATAAALFGQAEDELIGFTTNSAVVAEVVFILTSPRHYGLGRVDAVGKVRPLLELSACKLQHKDRIIRSLVRWQNEPRLSFVDALVVEQAIDEEGQLASFHKQVRRISPVELWLGASGP